MKFSNSKKFYNKSKKVLAGPSTFGKSYDLFLNNAAPFVLDRCKDAYAYDVDGNKYIDTISSLVAIILGHANSEVNNFVKKQIDKGSSYSVPSKLEQQLAKILCDNIPSAEMVKFGKNGNDVTGAAIRLARHYTKKNHILYCGYHGWQDWYVCNTSMDSGIPVEIKRYTHSFKYNDVRSLDNLFKKYKNQVACVILEPISKEKPICPVLCSACKKDKRKKCFGFLNRIQKLTRQNNALLIFDEVVTGFRFSSGGYQKICKITPDLSCFSKAMANGFPLAALVGKKKIMSQFSGIYYSLTFAGETMSLAASIKTIQLLKKNKVYAYIHKQGSLTREVVEKKINDLNLKDFIKILGHPGKLIFVFNDFNNISGGVLRLYWIKRLAELGVLTNGTQILNYSHNQKIINMLIKNYSIVLEEIKKLIKNDFFLKFKNKIKLNKDIREI